jgi:hypothetical protein
MKTSLHAIAVILGLAGLSGWGAMRAAETEAKVKAPRAAKAARKTPAGVVDARYVHATVRYPVPDGIDLTVPGELGNQTLAKLGYVDATAAPFFADSSGARDATRALQAAIDFARDHQLVCFLPLGTYRVSDTLHCVQNYYQRANGAIGAAPNVPCALVGSGRKPGVRPVIFLAPNAPGFSDPQNRKFVIHVYNRGVKEGGVDVPQANVSFRQMLRNFDIRIGEGNAGAVGLRMQAAEGSTAQDITIDATHGFIGMQGAAGSGGSHHNITVIGGRIGIDTHGFPPEFTLDRPGTQPTPTFAHVTLLHQSEMAIFNYSRGPAVWVGLKIVTDRTGPVIVGDDRNVSSPLDSSLAFVDSEIVFTRWSERNTVLRAGRSVYLTNVYVQDGHTLVEGAPVRGGPGWTRVRRLAVPIAPPPSAERKVQFDEAPWRDGCRSPEIDHAVAASSPPPADLRSRHIWADDFPTFESPGAVNVMAPPFEAKGDSFADDTTALQRAIDEHEIVFLPKGYYRLTHPLRLRPNTKLIGVAQHLSSLLLRDPGPAFSDPARPAALLETADDPQAETFLGFLGVLVPYEWAGAGRAPVTTNYYAVLWRCGARSIYRANDFKFHRLAGFTSTSGDEYPVLGGGDQAKREGEAVRADRQTPIIGHSLVRIAGHGGGKWYNFHHTWAHPARTGPGVRNLLIEGTSQPLAFYHLSAQVYNYNLPEPELRAPYSIELRRCANVDLFGVKTEHRTSFALVRECRNLRIIGHGGGGQPENKTWQYRFEDCDDFLLSNFGDQVYLGQPRPEKQFALDEFVPLVEVRGTTESKVPSRSRPIAYQRGEPRGAHGDLDR